MCLPQPAVPLSSPTHAEVCHTILGIMLRLRQGAPAVLACHMAAEETSSAAPSLLPPHNTEEFAASRKEPCSMPAAECSRTLSQICQLKNTASDREQCP